MSKTYQLFDAMNALGLSQGRQLANKKPKQPQQEAEAKSLFTTENIKFAAARFVPFVTVVTAALLVGNPRPTISMLTEKLLNPFK